MADATQVQAWMRELARARSATVAEIRGGVVLHSAEFSLAYDHNVVLLWEPTDASTAADAAESLLAGAGVGHLAIEVHGEALADALAPGLAERGFARTDVALMRFAEAFDAGAVPERPAAVDVLDVVERARAGTASWVDDDPAMPPDETRQLGDRITSLPDWIDATFLAVRGDDGVPIASLDLYVAGGIAQLEALHTLARFRGAGIASSLIAEGLRLATASGATTVFLAVEAEDGPVTLYERFGFRTFGRIATFAKDLPAPVV